jgi:hypothetical protein
MKRSAQVALVLMSAATVGGAGYAMMPPQNCAPSGSAVPNAAVPNTAAPKGVAPNAIDQSCTSRSPWHFRSGRSIFGPWGRSTSTSPDGRANLTSSNRGNSAPTTTTSRTSSGDTTRGGFGGTSTALASRGG